KQANNASSGALDVLARKVIAQQVEADINDNPGDPNRRHPNGALLLPGNSLSGTGLVNCTGVDRVEEAIREKAKGFRDISVNRLALIRYDVHDWDKPSRSGEVKVIVQVVVDATGTRKRDGKQVSRRVLLSAFKFFCFEKDYLERAPLGPWRRFDLKA